MERVMTGRAITLGDNIDTDVIAPAQFGLSAAPTPEEWDRIRKTAFGRLRPDLYRDIRAGDILTAGGNFGHGSHRVRANIVLRYLGFQAVIAESFARIYFRNSISIGFPAFEAPGITAIVGEGDRLEIDTENLRVTNRNTGEFCALTPHGPMVREILDAGGIFEMMRRRL